MLPSFKDHYNNVGELPKLITFSFAALLAFYSSADLREDGLYAKRNDGTEYVIRDDRPVLEFMAEYSVKPAAEFVDAAAAREDFWGEDLRKYDGFVETVAADLEAIRKDVKAAVEDILK